MQTLGVSVKQLRRKLLELGARILHVQGSKPRDMALVVRVSKMCSFSHPSFSPLPSFPYLSLAPLALDERARRFYFARATAVEICLVSLCEKDFRRPCLRYC